MNATPLLSFIVLSYNYADYIGQTIQSILHQTVPDFEVVIVDDASSDRSLEVIRSFADDRIRLLVNDRNLGGAASYNRAVQAATGKYLVNLDSDDWIVPDKVERQLAELTRQPVEILGSYAWFVDRDGNPHPNAADHERLSNQPHALNEASAWIGDNRLIRSTTMVERAAHLRIGLDDPTMVSAPDFELWTRALRAGCRFHVLPEPLTYYRVHDRAITHRDPVGTFLELSYATMRNLVPFTEEQKRDDALALIVRWLTAEADRIGLDVSRSHRLCGMLVRTPEFADFADFTRQLATEEDNQGLAVSGRRVRAALPTDTETRFLAKLQADLAAVSAARDFWHDQVESLTQARDFWHDQVEALTRARDFWHQTSDAWEEKSRSTQPPEIVESPGIPRRFWRNVSAAWRSPKE
jgi:glycosyltransferase involved in cell wall biosynthesis